MRGVPERSSPGRAADRSHRRRAASAHRGRASAIPSGVGPEVTARALAALRREFDPFVFGDPRVLARDLDALGLPVDRARRAAPGGRRAGRGGRGSRAAAVRPGKPAPGPAPPSSPTSRPRSRRSARGEADALCTAPVSKAQVARALPGFVGHTEWLEARCGVRRSVMMLAGERLKVALVTNHVAFARLRRALTPAPGSSRRSRSPTARCATTSASPARASRSPR